MVEVDALVFDQQNPRFTPDKKPEGATDKDIIRFIDRSADLGELIPSMLRTAISRPNP